MTIGVEGLRVVIICGSDEHTLLNCLSSLQSQGVSLHVTVINNGALSTIRPLELALTASCLAWEIIDNTVPLGFSANNNSVIRRLPRTAHAVLLLNDDTVMQPDALTHMLTLLDSSPDVGAVAPV